MSTVLSYGGGIQSTALLALACERKVDLDAVVYVDLGAAESPATLRYVHDYALPRALDANIHVAVSAPQTLYEDMIQRPEFVHAPFRTADGKFLKRQCTYHYKIVPFRRIIRQMFPRASKKRPLRVLYGISVDEYHRMRNSDVLYLKNEYPLVDMRWTRRDCVEFLVRSGWTVPPKSSCWFCPFRSRESKAALLSAHPHLRTQAIALERAINGSRRQRGLDQLQIIDVLADSHRQACMFGCEW